MESGRKARWEGYYFPRSSTVKDEIEGRTWRAWVYSKQGQNRAALGPKRKTSNAKGTGDWSVRIVLAWICPKVKLTAFAPSVGERKKSSFSFAFDGDDVFSVGLKVGF